MQIKTKQLDDGRWIAFATRGNTENYLSTGNTQEKAVRRLEETIKEKVKS